MTFTESVQTVFSKYASFGGRASRSEYWYFVLFNCLVSTAITLIAYIFTPVHTVVADGSNSFYMSVYQTLPGWASTLLIIYSLAVLLPTLAVTVRRLHDTGRGGGWIFISFVPLIGALWLFILLVFPSEAGSNRFGVQPE